MPYDEFLADRIKITLKEKGANFTEKKMMGGLSFFVNEKQCIGVIKNELIVRVSPKVYAQSLNKKGCKKMDFTKKSLEGYLMIEPAYVDMDKDLEYWIELSLNYNSILMEKNQ